MKKYPRLNPKNISKNILSEESVKLCFLVTFNIIVSYIFPENLTEILEVSRDINFYFVDFNYLRELFFIFLHLLLTKTNDVSIFTILSVIF